MSKVAIVGYGHVGRAMHKIFPDAFIYDPFIEEYKETQKLINKECDLAIVCVWTGSNKDGSCDTSIVESSIAWLKTPLILIKSTIEPGTTDRLKAEYKKRICFSPEYFGEFSYWVPQEWSSAQAWPYMVIGGEPEDRQEILNFFIPKLGPLKTYFQCTSTEAEIIKYTENAYLGLKVTFVNEVYDICQAFGVSWEQVREGWILDPRVNPSHTAVFVQNRGYSQKCLPKDILAFAKAAQKQGYRPQLLESVISTNNSIRNEKKPAEKVVKNGKMVAAVSSRIKRVKK